MTFNKYWKVIGKVVVQVHYIKVRNGNTVKDKIIQFRGNIQEIVCIGVTQARRKQLITLDQLLHAIQTTVYGWRRHDSAVNQSSRVVRKLYRRPTTFKSDTAKYHFYSRDASNSVGTRCHRYSCVRLSVKSRRSNKTAKRRITQTTPHDSRGILVFWCRKSRQNSKGSHPQRRYQMKVGRLNTG